MTPSLLRDLSEMMRADGYHVHDGLRITVLGVRVGDHDEKDGEPWMLEAALDLEERASTEEIEIALSTTLDEVG